MSREDMMAHSIQSLERIILNKNAAIKELVQELKWILFVAGESPAGAILAWEKRAAALIEKHKDE